MTGSDHAPPDDAPDARATLASLLRDPGTGWSLGVPGAIAEFFHGDGDAYNVHAPEDLVVATGRGAIHIHPRPGIRPIAYDAPSQRGDGRRRGLVVALPARAARMAGPEGLADLGPDAGAVRERDRNSALFDLGLPTDRIRACVRTDDRNLAERLRKMSGMSALAPGGALGRAIVEASPHRIFMSALGRIEVYQPIPKSRDDAHLLDGPHTHLLPGLFGGEEDAPWAPLAPPTHAICLQAHPPHPPLDRQGGWTPLDRDAHERFRRLLGRWGATER